jgi:HEAT repeat protein
MRKAIMYKPLLFLSGILSLALANPVQSQPTNKEVDTQKANTPINGKTLLDWEKDLTDKDPSVKEEAIHSMMLYGTAARKSVSKIIKIMMYDPDVGLKVNAVIALGFIQFDNEKDQSDCVQGMTALLNSTQGIVRFQAAKALGRIGRAGAPAVGRLILLTKDPASWEIRRGAAFALGSVGYDPKIAARPDGRAVNALIDVLQKKDECSEVRLEALYSLIIMGIPYQLQDKSRELQVLHALINNKHQPDKVHIWAYVAIMRIEKVSEQYLVILAKFLRNPKLETRTHAARAFATIGPEGKSRIEDLVDALSDKDPTMLYWTCQALAQMGDLAQKAIPQLQKLLTHTDPTVRTAAQDALNAIMEKRKKN